MKPRYKICVVTTSRADFGIYRSVLAALSACDRTDVGLFPTGMHLRPDMGRTIDEVVASGLPVWAAPEIMLASDTPEAAVKAMALGQLAAADFFAADRRSAAPIDLLVVLGDRFEMFAIAAAAQPFRIPVAHIAGGDETEGAIDNAFRHALTKLSHLHLVTTPGAADRVRAMGEAPEHIHVTGSPALDMALRAELFDRSELHRIFGVPRTPYVLATVHSETLGGGGDDESRAVQQLDTVLAAVRDLGLPVVFTSANADPGGLAINRRIRALAGDKAAPVPIVHVESFGAKGYFSALRDAAVVVGNSSSGITEAAAFRCPVIDIGDRQRGRERAANVIDVPWDAAAIRTALVRAVDPAFRESLAGLVNPHGDGHADERILAAILGFLDAGAPIRKTFHR